jgi:prolyl 4-hydroxylase
VPTLTNSHVSYHHMLQVNHWESPTFLISVDDKGLRGSGPELKEHIWAAASATLEEWTSQELQPVSMYGIRVYGEGAVMMPHVDRLPLVASAMICVAQDVDVPWPTEIYDHSGHAHNVTMEPGDMLLFESHSVVHGHPFPLQGRFQAMIFIHFEPTGQSLLHDASGWHVDEDGVVENSSSNDNKKSKKSINQEYKSSVNQGIGGQSSATSASGSLPPYIQRATPEEKNWRKQHPEGWKPVR